MNKLLIAVISFLFLLAGCSSFPPLAFGYSFPATVTISTPGWSAPVAIQPSAAVNAPVLMLPLGVAHAATANVAASGKAPARTVPIINAPVTSPVLAVPTIK